MRQVMQGTAVALALAIGAAGALRAQTETADELVARNLKAKGGVEKLKAVQGMKITGRLTVPSAAGGIEIPMTILTKRPNRFRQESTVDGKQVIIAFDGQKAWMVNPMMGIDTPQPITGERLEMLKQQADLDGPLVDYKAKGTTIVAEGTETFDGKTVQKLKVTPKSGRVVYLYLDDRTGLEAKTTMEAPPDPQSGAPATTLETVFSNYQQVGSSGLVMPHTVQQKTGGQVAVINIEKIEVTPAVEDSVFSMPATASTPPPTSPPGDL